MTWKPSSMCPRKRSKVPNHAAVEIMKRRLHENAGLKFVSDDRTTDYLTKFTQSEIAKRVAPIKLFAFTWRVGDWMASCGPSAAAMMMV
jgi:hypothetical protein